MQFCPVLRFENMLVSTRLFELRFLMEDLENSIMEKIMKIAFKYECFRISDQLNSSINPLFFN